MTQFNTYCKTTSVANRIVKKNNKYTETTQDGKMKACSRSFMHPLTELNTGELIQNTVIQGKIR